MRAHDSTLRGTRLEMIRAEVFPRTALPELLGVAPRHFPNTRIHRVLEKLDGIETELQDGLVRRYEQRDGIETELQDGLVRRYAQRDGIFATLFTDVSDVWFEGRGLAELNWAVNGMISAFFHFVRRGWRVSLTS